MIMFNSTSSKKKKEMMLLQLINIIYLKLIINVARSDQVENK